MKLDKLESVITNLKNIKIYSLKFKFTKIVLRCRPSGRDAVRVGEGRAPQCSARYVLFCSIAANMQTKSLGAYRI